MEGVAQVQPWSNPLNSSHVNSSKQGLQIYPLHEEGMRQQQELQVTTPHHPISSLVDYDTLASKTLDICENKKLDQ